jgi:glycosyltransferase involved in cell wall biosynthesis
MIPRPQIKSDSRAPAEEHAPHGGAGRRVLIIVQNLPVPFDRRVWLEATTLVRNGYQVSVICPKMKGFNESFEALEDVEIFRYSLPFEARGALGFIAEFFWCFICTAWLSLRIGIMGRGFDALHVCNPPETYWLLGLVWRSFGKLFIFDHHDLSPEMYGVKFGKTGGALYRLLLVFERLTFMVAKVVITTNESHKEIAVRRGAKQPHDVFVVRSGPELARFQLHRPDPSWRASKRYLLSYLGEICEQDGVDHLVRAARILRDEIRRSDFHCIVVGGGPHQPAIVNYARELGVADLFTFTGRVDDDMLCRILSSADVAIDPDPKNEWSDKSTMNKIIEYMYFGLPIVAYDLVEARVSAGASALFVSPNSERALAIGINHLLDNDALREEMRQIGMRRVRDELAWDYSAPVLLAAYDQAFRLREVRRQR